MQEFHFDQSRGLWQQTAVARVDTFTLCVFMWACFPLFDSEAREWEARFYQIHSKYMLLLNELQTPEGCQNSPTFRELVARLMGDSVTENIPSLRWVSIAVAAAAAAGGSSHRCRVCRLHLSAFFDQINDICVSVQIMKLVIMHTILLLYTNILHTSQLSGSYSWYSSSERKTHVSYKHAKHTENNSLLLSNLNIIRWQSVRIWTRIWGCVFLQVFQYDLWCVRIPAGGNLEGKAASHAGMKRFNFGWGFKFSWLCCCRLRHLGGGTVLSCGRVRVFGRTAWPSSSRAVSLWGVNTGDARHWVCVCVSSLALPIHIVLCWYLHRYATILCHISFTGCFLWTACYGKWR